MSTTRTKTETVQTPPPPKDLSRRIVTQAGQSYVFSWSWFFGGIVVLTLICASVFGMRTINVFNMSKQVVDIAKGLEEEGNTKGAIDVLAAFLASRPNSPDVWAYQCDLWSDLYKSKSMTSYDMLTKAIDRHKQALAYLPDDSSKEVRARILEMELEVAKSNPGNWAITIDNARDTLKLWNNDPLAMKVLAMGVFKQFLTAGRRPAQEDLPLDDLLRNAWELNKSDIDLSIDYATFLRNVKPDWQNIVSSKVHGKEASERNLEADDIVDVMVRNNADNAEAYLARYEYHLAANAIDLSRPDLEPDLVKALELSPNSTQALQSAGRQMFISSHYAQAQGKTKEAEENRDKAHEYFSKMIQVDPTGPEGYMSLGKWYIAAEQVDKALEVWNEGRAKIGYVSPYLDGEIAYVSIDQKLYDQAKTMIDEIEQFSLHFASRKLGATGMNLVRIYSLLRGKLYMAQRDDAVAKRGEALRKIAEAKAKGQSADPTLERLVQESSETAERLRNMAAQVIHSQLTVLYEKDYDLSGGTVLSRLEGEAYLTSGRLEAEMQAWEKAAEYYQKARVFPSVAALATIQTANALERSNRPQESLGVLQDGARRFPDNSALRFLYLNALFAQELAKPEASTRNYTLLENELNDVEQFKDKLPQPWKLDTMRVQLQYVRGGGTLAVQRECLARLRELEGEDKYKDDPLFFADIASQYSSMGSFDDFSRVVNRVRELPKGESVYYLLRIDDAKRREDSATALLLVDEALTSVADADKERFARMKSVLENPELGGVPDPDEEFGRLKNLYDGHNIHDAHTFFELGNLAFSRGEVELAKNIEDRLKQIEGEKTGTLWRYMAVRRLVKQSEGNPNSELLNSARAFQRDIAALRPNWDMTFVLKAEIEKETGNINEAIVAYQEAIARGCRQPMVYRDLISLYYQVGRADDGEKLRRLAGSVFGPGFFESGDMFPPPYQGYYEQIFKAIQEGNIGSADDLANACIKKALENKEPTDRILDLNTRIGKLFMDSSNAASAERFLAKVAEQGGKFIFPLAVCYIKMEKVDEAFELFVRELEKPTVDPSVLTSVLILSTQATPSEAIQQKIDRQLERLEPVFTEKLEFLLQLGDYWINRNRLDHAIPIYRKGLEMEPNNLLILNNLAMLLAESGQGGTTTIARGTFNANEAKRIQLTDSQPKKTYILRFPKPGAGQAAPNPEDFRFLSAPQ